MGYHFVSFWRSRYKLNLVPACSTNFMVGGRGSDIDASTRGLLEFGELSAALRFFFGDSWIQFHS